MNARKTRTLEKVPAKLADVRPTTMIDDSKLALLIIIPLAFYNSSSMAPIQDQICLQRVANSYRISCCRYRSRVLFIECCVRVQCVCCLPKNCDTLSDSDFWMAKNGKSLSYAARTRAGTGYRYGVSWYQSRLLQKVIPVLVCVSRIKMKNAQHAQGGAIMKNEQ